MNVTDRESANSYPGSFMNCSIISGQDSTRFSFNNCSDVTNTEEFNLDGLGHTLIYHVTLMAEDGGIVSDTAYVEVEVLDINDNDPKFNQTLYTAYIPGR